MIHLVLFGGCALLITAFVLEPLFRAETDIEPLDRTWPGVAPRRDLDSVEDPSQTECAVSHASDGDTLCLACGAPKDPAYTYCAHCLAPSPR